MKKFFVLFLIICTNSNANEEQKFFNLLKKNDKISKFNIDTLRPYIGICASNYFKILNKKGINLTLGLNYKRTSPAHGTAKDIKYKNTADNSSFIACMEH